jgi:hypothetical protein
VTKGLIGVILGLVTFIIVQQLVGTLVTGSDTGSLLIINILALAVAIGVVVGALRSFLSGSKGD